MNSALLKQLICSDCVKDIWNHITGDTVTVVYQQGEQKRRLIIGIDEAGSRPLYQHYQAATPFYQLGMIQKCWSAVGETPEEAVAAVWIRAEAELVNALANATDVSPVCIPDISSPNGPMTLVWSASAIRLD